MNCHIFQNLVPSSCTYRNGLLTTGDVDSCGLQFTSRTCTENVVEIGCVGP